VRSLSPRATALVIAGAVLVAAAGGWRVYAQAQAGPAARCDACGAPVNDLPNPYRTVTGSDKNFHYFKLPAGRTWGSTAAVDMDKDGKTIWVAERCGGNSCLDAATGQMSPLDPVLHFDENGNLLKSFGAGLIVMPHGIFVDKDDNVWVTDNGNNAPAPARGAAGGAAGRGAARGAAAAAPAAPAGPPPGPFARGAVGVQAGATKGSQVLEFSKDGKLLRSLGLPGGAAEPSYFYQPNDVLVAPNGDIFVGEIHGGGGLLLKFDPTGKLIKTLGRPGGAPGSGPGEFDIPHCLAMDSKGRLFVGDRNNNRIQIFDQNLNFIDQWHQFGRPSGLFIDKNDNLYVADSESDSVSQNHAGWKRGMRIGSAKDGKVVAFIPDPETRVRPEFTNTSAAEGVAVDAKGNIYGAEVGPRDVKKYVKK